MSISVLHITGWYRSSSDPGAVPFIKEHFEALNRFARGYLLHVEVKQTPGCLLSFRYERLSDKEESYIASTSIRVWRIIELISFVLMMYAMRKHGIKRYDVVNFHVAYPNLTYHNIVKRIIRKPFILIEHWTAFHYEFNMPKGSKKLNKIRGIYRQQYPLMVVSRRLGRDIQEFAGCPQKRLRVIPNVVDDTIFYYDPDVVVPNRAFFMVNYWREIKDPFPVLNAFTRYLEVFPDAKLRIAGYGPLWNKILSYVEKNKLTDSVFLLGRLCKHQIADELRKASALLHHADYETFSVVCAEAISCGCPVIVNYLEAVAEFIDGSNGILVESGRSFMDALLGFDAASFDRAQIARKANARFRPDEVGKQYLKYNLDEIHEHSGSHG
jgi:glycosyltransferase involved in cell wall biosynthesis